MRKSSSILLAVLTALALAGAVEAHGGPGGGRPGPGGGGPGPGGGAPPGGGRHPGPGGPHGPGRPGVPNPDWLWKWLDKDGDGKISAAEAKAAGRLGAKIMAADADGDGFVTKDELRAYEQAQAFKRLDKNGDGVLDATEAGTHLKAADADGDGKITLQEFKDFLAKLVAQAQAAQQAMAAFHAADANKDHKLDASEWPLSATAAFADVDTNHDGFVTPREVAEYMKANGKSPF